MNLCSANWIKLTVLQALRRASTEPEKNADLRDVLDSTIALVFFGTPHRGGAYTNLALTATKIAKAAGFDVHDQNIRDLKGDSPVLTLLRRDFAQLLDSDNFEVSTFQEALGYHGAGLLKGKVSRMALLLRIFGRIHISFDRHLMIFRSSRTNHPCSTIAMNE